MDDDFEKIRIHFLKALEIDNRDTRLAFIDQCVHENPEIGDRLRKMISAHHESTDPDSSQPNGSSAVDEPLDRTTALPAGSNGQPETAPPGDDFLEIDSRDLEDQFLIQEKIGEGGFGIVYLAEQQKPLRRKVALKVIKPGMETREVISRFQLEQGALAIMDHPGIAKVLDSGKTKSGRPYFVMDYLDGLPISEYCDEKKLSIVERLELFLEICDAIQHAHQKGVIHRDLKPSNVIVVEIDGKPTPKVIDFGIAKALTPQFDDVSYQTNLMQLVGSPRYMSPEQAGYRGLPVDTRSDIYSAGILLYQMLVGVTPHAKKRFSSLDVVSIFEAIKNEETVNLSLRFKNLPLEKQEDVAARRNLSIPMLSKVLQKEVFWIANKAIEKDPENRYQSIRELAEDLRNYLGNQPVAARPKSRVYFVRKFVSRHRNEVAVGALMLASLVFGLIFSLFQLQRARDAEDVGALRLTANQILQKRTEAALEKVTEAEADLKNQVYAGDMRLAAQEIDDGDVSAGISILDRYLPRNEADRRGIEWHFLSRLYQRDHRPLQKQLQPFSFARYLPNSDLLVTGDYAGKLYLFDARTEKLIREFYGHREMVNFVDISPQGDRLVSAGADGVVHLWDLSTGQSDGSFQVSDSEVYRVFFDASGERLITSTEEPVVRVWDVKSKKQVAELNGLNSEVKRRLEFNREQGLLVVSKNAFNVCSFELATLKKKVSFDCEEGGRSRCLAVSRDGRFVAGGRDSQWVTLWDAVTGKVISQFLGHRDDIQSVAFHPTEELVVSSDRSGIVRFWPFSSSGDPKNHLAPQWPAALDAHGDRIWSVDFSGDGSKIVTAGRDKQVKIWMADGPGILPLPKTTLYPSVSWINEGELIVSSREKLFLWDLESDEQRLLAEDPAEYYRVDFCKQLGVFALGTCAGQIEIWNAASIRKLRDWNGHATGGLNELRFGGRENRLISTGEDGRAVVWDPHSGEPLHQVKWPNNFDAAVFLGLGESVALCNQNDIWIWNLAEGSLKQRLRGHNNTAEDLVEVPGQGLLVSGSDDRTIRTWQVDNGLEQRLIEGHDAKINAIAISKDGNTVISGDDSGQIMFADLKTGRRFFKFNVMKFWPNDENTNPPIVTDIRVSPDGKKIAVAVCRRGIVILEVAEWGEPEVQ